MPVTAGALLTSVCINGSVGLACLLVFGGLRKWKVTKKLYEPKRYTGSDQDASQPPARLATSLPEGLLSWTRAVWVYPEQDVIQQCGLDVAVFFRLMHLGVRLFLFLTLWCCVVVMPVNYTGGYLERHHKRHDPQHPYHPCNPTLRHPACYSPTNTSGTTTPHHQALAAHYNPAAAVAVAAAAAAASSGDVSAAAAVGLLGNFSDAIHTNLDLLTLSNVPPGSRKMWIHLASVYIITLAALKLLWDLSRDIAFKRANFLATEASRRPGSSSVLLTDIPGLEWGTPLHRLQLSWLKWMLPGALFRRGFDQQQQQQQQQSSLRVPLLLTHSTRQQQQQQQQCGDDVIPDVWCEAVNTLQHNGGDVQALVRGEMSEVYGADSVSAVVPVHNTHTLDAAAAKYWQLAGQFEDVLDWYQCHLPLQQQQQQQEGEGHEEDVEAAAGPTTQAGGSKQQQQSERQQLLPGRKHRGKRLERKKVLVVGARHGAWGIERYGVTPCKVDALEFYSEALQQQLRELRHLQHQARHQLPRPAAFVTFRSQLTSTLAAASLHSYDEAAWTISPAPGAQEVDWSALGLRSWERALRQLVVWGVFWLLVLFYAPIVAAIQAPVNMDNLRKIPILADLLSLPLVSSILQGFLPSLVLLVFLAVAPYLLRGIIQWAGLASMTQIDAQLIGMYFLFQLFAVFIFSFISGTALSQLQGLIDDPHKIVSLLGVSAPQQASFFSTWTLLLGLSRTPLQLLRLPQLAWYLLRLQLADTPRQRQRLWSEQQTLLGYVLPLHTLVLLLGLVFCVASPLIAPVTLLYFISSSVTQKYQWIYIYRHPYEGAGMLWRQVFNQVLVGVYFFVAVMGSLLGIKRFEYALLLLPLAAGVVVFHVLASRALQRPLTLPSAREAAAVDRRTGLEQQQQEVAEHHPAGPEPPGSGPAAAAASGSDPQPALEATELNPEAPSPDSTPQVTRRTAGDVGRAFGEVNPEEACDDLYLAPSLKLSQQHLQPLLDEAADIQRRLAALGW